MQTIRDLLAAKGTAVHSATPDTTVYNCLEKMAEHNIGALVVVAAKGKLAGIFSERDYARNVGLKGKNSKDTPVSAVMTSHVCTATPELTIEEAMAMMSRIKCRHLPVLEDGQLAGMISIGDVVKALLGEKQFMIKQLEQYISGSL
jgi:CBS domain-containing protein